MEIGELKIGQFNNDVSSRQGEWATLRFEPHALTYFSSVMFIDPYA